MKNYKLHVPEGFKDTYGNEMLIKKDIENRVLNCFNHYGYIHIKTPTVEYIDLYSDKGLQKPDLYNLINRQGEVLSLCNDMTRSIARFVASKNDDSKGIKRYSYIADTFRYPRLYQGKNHQFLQAGVELIGKSNEYCDTEAIYLAYMSLKACNINQFTIHLGSSKFLNLLLDDFKINSDNKNEIFKTIENKDYVTLRSLLNKNLDSDKAEFIIDLMLKGGRLRYLDSLMEKLKGYKALEELKYLKNLFNMLMELDVKDILFDFSIYAYAGYYTGILFQIYIENMKKSVITGGRTDNLIKEFGKDLADIGFGIDLDILTDYVIENNLININNEKYLSLSDKESFVYAMKNNEEFRNKGIIVGDSHLENLDDAMEYAKQNGYTKIIWYKNNKYQIVEVK